jgi:MFS family permease
MENRSKNSAFTFWSLIWLLGIAGQLCWNIENQWFNTFIYAKIARDPTIISWMVAISAIATAFSTFFWGTFSDRRGKRRKVIAGGYILWGIFTIVFGLTQYITGGHMTNDPSLILKEGLLLLRLMPS